MIVKKVKLVDIIYSRDVDVFAFAKFASRMWL